MLENLILKIVAESNLDQTQAELKACADGAQSLEEGYMSLSGSMDKNARSASREEKAIERSRKSITSLSRGVQLTSMSMNALRERSRRLQDALDRTSRAANPRRYRELQRGLEATEKAMNKLGRASKASQLMSNLSMKAAAGWVTVLYTLQQALRDAFDVIKDFDAANGNLASILGKTQAQTVALQKDAERLGASTSYTASQMTNLQIELAKLGFTETEILQATEAVQRFATASGSELAEAAALAGSALRAFGMDASEMERAVATMGVATTKSALDFRYLETAMSTIAPVAKSFGFTIEDTTALLGTLANSGFDASSAATATRNILLNLSDSSGKLAKALGRPIKSMDDLIPALAELKNKGIDLGDALELTDKRSVAAFNTFLSGVDTLGQLRDGITDVSDELKKMEDTKLETLSGRIDLLHSAWDGLMLSFQKTKGPISAAIDGITEMLSATKNVVDGPGGFFGWIAGMIAPDDIKAEMENAKRIKELDQEVENNIAEFRKKNIDDARESYFKERVDFEENEKLLLDLIADSRAHHNEELAKKEEEKLYILRQYHEKVNEAMLQMEEDQNKKLLEEEARQEVERKQRIKEAIKAAIEARKNALAENENKLKKMQLGVMGTEADYAQQIALEKKIAEQRAQVQIDALDKANTSAREYNAQVAAIMLERNKELQDIDKREAERKDEMRKTELQNDVTFAQQEVDALYGEENAEKRKEALLRLQDAKEALLVESARQEIAMLTGTEEEKSAKRKEIELRTSGEIAESRKNTNAQLVAIDSEYIDELERTVEKADRAVSTSQGADKLNALKGRLDAQMELYDAQQVELDSKYAAGLITYQEYKDKEFEILKAVEDAKAEYTTEKQNTVAEGFEKALDQIQQIGEQAFSMASELIQRQMDALEEEYTTDAEEAKKNSQKKLITEKEYARKEAEIKRKAAAAEKAEAAFSIGLSTAMAIMRIWADVPKEDWGAATYALTAVAAALGAAQLGMALSKPLPAYAKGRNGGQGEYALVGERGPEIMYVPQGASIVPNNKLSDMDAWSAYGVPRLTMPELPNVNGSDIAPYVFNANIDYDRLGKAVAANIPAQKAVMVNVDRNGIHVTDGHDTHTYLNKKYNGSWH